MAEMDQGIKRLVQTHPADLLALVLPQAEHLGAMPTEIATEPQLTLDTLQRVRYQGVECAVDIEAEARPRPEMARRCFEYGARASIVFDMPVLSVVLWLEPGGSVPPSPYELRVGDRLLATWHFIGIELYRLQAQDLLRRGAVGLLPLIPFTAGGRTLERIEEAAQLVRDHASPDEVGELESLLAVFGARSFGAEAMRTLLRRVFMNREIIETSPLYQEWIRDATARGLEQGREQGADAALREAVMRVLQGRFGPLPADMPEAIAQANRSTLGDLLDHVATASLEQLRAQLGLRG